VLPLGNAGKFFLALFHVMSNNQKDTAQNGLLLIYMKKAVQNKK
jgi:hypothetical protein